MKPYKDRAFCTREDCAKFNTCPEALTDSIKEDAYKWWGSSGAPIRELKYMPDCYTPKAELTLYTEE